MQKRFPRQYWLAWLGAALLFVLTIPWNMFSNEKITVHYAWFCLVLDGLSIVLFRTIALRMWVKQFYTDSCSVYAWLLAVQAFCHLVFVGMNPLSWVYLAITAALWLVMLALWWKDWKKNRDSGKTV